MLDYSFGSPEEWPDQDLIGFSQEFDASVALAAYRCGVFPMPLDTAGYKNEMGWWAPLKRGILSLEKFRITKSMRASAKHYQTTIDFAFSEVIRDCANPKRPGGWINNDIARVYQQLHSFGVAHSVETWDSAGRLVGGLYGISIGGLFAGESMFHHPVYGRDGSKVALMRLVYELSVEGALLDVQWATSHLISLGAEEISREEYLQTLSVALERKNHDWPAPEESMLSGNQLVQLLGRK